VTTPTRASTLIINENFDSLRMPLWVTVSREASGKSRKNWRPVRRAGHRKFLHYRVKKRQGSPAKTFQPAVFSDLCVKGLCDKEAFLLT